MTYKIVGGLGYAHVPMISFIFYMCCTICSLNTYNSWALHVIPPSYQTSSHYVCPTGLKLCVNFLNVVQTYCMGYKLSGWARMSRTLNLLKIVWRSSHSEPILGNGVGTSVV